MNEPDPIKPFPMDDPEYKAFADAWIHLTPLQKKVILWRVSLLAIRARAARFIRSLFS